MSILQFLDSSSLKEFADNNFKFNENGREVSIRVKNTVGKREMACYEQFHAVSSKYLYCTHVKETRSCLGKGYWNFVLEKVENIVGEREKFWQPSFSCFSTVFCQSFLCKGCKHFRLRGKEFAHSHLLTPLGNKPFENTVGKGEIARKFILFPQCFLPAWITFFHLREIKNCRLQTLSGWISLKFVIW